MIDGESRGFADATSLAHRLLFFIVSDFSSVIRKWNIPHRSRKNPDHVGENAHLNALLWWRLKITLMAKQLLSKGRTTKCEAPLWQKKRF
jgi:hypothetical protein